MAQTKKPLVSVVVLNWNRIEDTLTCVESVKKMDYENFEVIVVDNGSIDTSKSVLHKRTDIVFVDNPVNRGFTGGHIDGLKVAKGEYVFILNNDAVVSQDYLSIAVEDLENDPEIAVVGGRAYFWSDKNKAYDTNAPFYAYQNINPATAEAIFPQTDSGKLQIVNNVSGSAAVIRRSVLDAIGYFYEPFFAYYEEADLFARMKRSGHKVVYDPRLGIWHRNGSSSSSYFQFNQLFKNRFVFAVRNFETSYLPGFLKNYIKVGLQSTYMRFRPSDNPSLHKGFSDAFLRSLVLWPKLLLSRRELTKSLNRNDIGYNTSLIIEGTSLSIVIDLTKATQSLILKTIDHYESLTRQYDRPIDVVLCLPSGSKVKTSLRFVRVTKHYSKNSLNLGWLSARHDYIVFCQKLLKPKEVDELFVEAAALAIKGAWTAYGPRDTWAPIHRELLVHSGGLATNEINSTTYSQLCLYASLWDDSKLISQTRMRDIFDNETVVSTLRKVHNTKMQDKPASAWDKFLARHYRIYQQRNLVKWLSSPKITTRLKLARTKNLVIFALSLQRKKFATELKHIRNEVIRTSFVGTSIDEQNKNAKQSIKHLTEDNNWKSIPVYIICRDRIDSLRVLLKWLKKAGFTNLVFIDNDSMYPELTAFLKATEYQVIPTGTNIGHTIPWAGGIIRTLSTNMPYIVTDPDVVPVEECPLDAVKHILDLHLKYFNHQKIGFGLKIDDLPEHFHLRQSVISWEKQFWKNELEPGIYEAGVDTTFAVYKPYTFSYFIHPSLRVGEPYVARHLPWYIDTKKITPEEKFYRHRLNDNITSWNVDEIADRYKVEMKRQSKKT